MTGECGKGATTMYTIVALKEKIQEMYPEIEQQRASLGLVFDEEQNEYLVTFRRGNQALTTHLGKKDADECMNGIKCVYLGIQIAQFIRNLGEREVFTQNAA